MNHDADPSLDGTGAPFDSEVLALYVQSASHAGAIALLCRGMGAANPAAPHEQQPVTIESRGPQALRSASISSTPAEASA